MSILIHNCTAVLMDEAGTVLPNAYVVVEGTKIRSVSTQRPWAPLRSRSTARATCSCPALSTPTAMCP